MLVNLSKEELAIIYGWYYSAAGEFATCRDEKSCREQLPLIAKLGFDLHPMDEDTVKKLDNNNNLAFIDAATGKPFDLEKFLNAK